MGGNHPLPMAREITRPEPGNDGFMDKIQQLDCVIPIFSCLNRTTMVSTAAVSRFWNQYSLQFVKNREFTLIKNFTEFLIENLGLDRNLGRTHRKKSYSKQIESLSNLFSDQTILNPINLIQVELSIIILRKKKIRILEVIKDSHLQKLETMSRVIEKPLFFENIFDLASEYEPNEIYEIIDDEIKKDALCEIFDKSFKSEETSIAITDEIIQLSCTIQSDEIKSDALNHIFTHFSKNGPKKAFEFAKKINVVEIRDKFLHYIFEKAKKHIKRGRRTDMVLYDLIGVAEAMSDSFTYKNNDLRFIIEKLIKERRIEKFIEFVDKITSMEKNRVFLDNFRILMDEKEIDYAIKVIEAIDDPLRKSYALCEIAQEFAKNNEIDRAIKFTGEINLDEKKGEALATISSNLLSKSLNINTINEFIKVAETINDTGLKNGAFNEIFNVLTYKYSSNNYRRYRSYDKTVYDKAIEVAKKIRDYKLADELISDCFLTISIQLIDLQQIDCAFIFAKEIRIPEKIGIICNCFIDQHEVSKALDLAIKITDDQIIRNICNHLIDQRKENEALDLVVKITNEKIRGEILEKISTTTFDDTLITRVILLANAITDAKIKESTLDTIFQYLVVSIETYKIKKFFSLITDKAIKNQILNTIKKQRF